MKNTYELKIERTNGQIEIVDVTEKWQAGLNSGLVAMIREATSKAGRGNVICGINKIARSNFMDLRRAYNNLQNEGAEGYMPEDNYFTSMPGYKEWIETVEVN